LLQLTEVHDGPVYGAVLTKDETRILSWSNDHTLRLWDVATGQQIGPAMKHGSDVNGAVLTKDETRVLSWSNDHTLRLWDVATGQQIGPAMKHDSHVVGAVTVERIDGGKLRCTGATWSDAVVIYPGEVLAFQNIERQAHALIVHGQGPIKWVHKSGRHAFLAPGYNREWGG
jgi:WD40 repeat protein